MRDLKVFAPITTDPTSIPSVGMPTTLSGALIKYRKHRANTVGSCSVDLRYGYYYGEVTTIQRRRPRGR